MEPALQINGLTKEYPGFKLDHVSFTLPCGTIMGLIGENGAGKSTTINAVLDLIRKDDGNILFWGKELSHNPRQLKEDIGVVFDGINFYETLTPVKVGKISAAAYRQWDPAAYKGFLDQFQLPADKEIKTFSKGMKMKLSIAAALSHHPKLLILDEATSSVDTKTERELQEGVNRMLKGRTSFIVAHRLSTIRACNKIMYIDHGEIAECGTHEELLARKGLYWQLCQEM